MASRKSCPPTSGPFPGPFPYAVHKQLGESYLPFFAQEHGLNWVVLRYANVYGPRQAPHAEAGVVAIFTQTLLAGRPGIIYRPDDMPGGMIRDYVFVKDVVAANHGRPEPRQGGIFNIGTGVATSTQQLYDRVAAAVGVELPPSYGPPRPGDLRRSLLDNSLAARELGWRPQVDLASGCRQ